MNYKNAKKLSATAISHSNGAITAYFNELPGLLVQGDSDDDVKAKLKIVLKSYIQRLNMIGDNFEINTRQF